MSTAPLICEVETRQSAASRRQGLVRIKSGAPRATSKSPLRRKKKIEQIDAGRLRIRQFNSDDVEHCRRFRHDVFGLDEVSGAAQSWLRWTIDSYRELANLGQPPYADYAIVLKDGGAFIGAVGIVPTVVPWGALKGDAQDRLLSPEIGLFWGILPEFRQRGYATEAARALLDILFQDLKARQVVATTEHDNIASQRIMAKLGMRLFHNPNADPHWRQIVGCILNPSIRPIDEARGDEKV